MGYVYCASYAGFNDILCQMGIAWDYARRHNRVLVVDTLRSGLHDDLGTYFDCSDPGIVLAPTKSLIDRLNTMSTYPPLVRGAIDTHPREQRGAVFYLPGTGYMLGFDLDRDYAEQVLVYYASVGGEDGALSLARLRMRPGIAAEVTRSLEPLGGSYAAVHVRNTDYETDYMPFFRELYPKMAGKTLLVCSDDWECRERAREFFAESRVVTVTEIPNTGQKPLHLIKTNVREKNLAMLTDLFGMAGAEELYVAPMKRGGINGESGFSILARKLRQYPRIRQAVLGTGEQPR